VIGIVLIVLFGIGHCIPIAIAGSSTATVKRLLESSYFYEGGFGSEDVPGLEPGYWEYTSLCVHFLGGTVESVRTMAPY